MKPRLTLKTMLIATAFCVIFTVIRSLLDLGWTSPNAFKDIFYWIIVLIGWAVFFLDKLKQQMTKPHRTKTFGAVL